MAVAPSLGGGLYAGTSPRLPGGPTHSAHTDRGKDVLRAGSNRGRSVAAILPPRGGLKTRCTAEANHAKFGLSGPHTVVLPELAESSNCILYNGLLGSRSCGRFLVSRGLAGPKCCSSTFARSRLPRTSFAKAVHGLNAAVPSCINGSGRWQLLPRPVVHTHRALLQPKLHALLPLGAAAAATHSAASGLDLVLELSPLSLLAARGAEELEQPRADLPHAVQLHRQVSAPAVDVGQPSGPIGPGPAWR